MEKLRILVVDDDFDLVALVRGKLEELGFEVAHSSNGLEALTMAADHPYALLVLDVMLPGLGGVELCRRLRAGGSETPILMLTGRSERIDCVVGLEAGADDYLTKPFHALELAARVRALLRRARPGIREPEVRDERLVFDGLQIDAAIRQVSVDGTPTELTKTEFDLLFVLASNPGRIFCRDELLNHIWELGLIHYEDNVTAHVSRLRKKLGRYAACIVTVRGIGYRFLRLDELEGAAQNDARDRAA